MPFANIELERRSRFGCAFVGNRRAETIVVTAKSVGAPSSTFLSSGKTLEITVFNMTGRNCCKHFKPTETILKIRF